MQSSKDVNWHGSVQLWNSFTMKNFCQKNAMCKQNIEVLCDVRPGFG